jgi:hypothetical protein
VKRLSLNIDFQRNELTDVQTAFPRAVWQLNIEKAKGLIVQRININE